MTGRDRATALARIYSVDSLITRYTAATDHGPEPDPPCVPRRSRGVYENRSAIEPGVRVFEAVDDGGVSVHFAVVEEGGDAAQAVADLWELLSHHSRRASLTCLSGSA